MVNRRTSRVGLATILASIATLLMIEPAIGDDGPRYGTEVRPILARCMACHGPDDQARQSGLRLDTFDGATADLAGYAAIVPGKPDSSELVVRVSETDPDLVMPPATHGAPLSNDEIQVLSDWISAGAKYEQHWAYIAPKKSELPVSKGDLWSKNEIDPFVLAKMHEQKLEPNESADRAALLRRASIDLTGLPPTIETVEQFLNDSSPNAWEKAVDRLLADPAFGERWASVWLDLARYADSQGYSSDSLRTIWPYRDYIIRSLNSNKPFDQFTIEQFAGDLMDSPTQESLIATAFHRNTLTNTEGGTDDEEFRSVAIVDRVNTTFAAWMGTTIACAQCHTHKYDPITQEEYFRFFAILNQTADHDQPDESPVMQFYSDGDLERIAGLDGQIEQMQFRVSEEFASDKTFENWLVGKIAVEPAALAVPLAKTIRLELPGASKILSLAEVEVFSNGEIISKSGTATQSSVDFKGPPELAIDGNTSGELDKDKSVTHTAREANPWWQLNLAQPQIIDQIRIWNRTSGDLPKRLDGFVLSLLDDSGNVIWRRSFKTAPEVDLMIPVSRIPEDVLTAMSLPVAERDEPTRKIVEDFAKESFEATNRKSLELADLITRRAAIKPQASVPVMREVDPEKRRETHIQIRGSFLNKADLVTAGTPAVFHPLPEDLPANRLAAARWLVDKRNPLTARVLVNRFWEQLFGTGLVSTSEDFGTQGEFPSHPELLDWLAVELMDSDWDCKHVLKLIVMSSTYGQSSLATPEKLTADSNNRYLARGPRVRLSAETVRDQALAVSGLLNRNMFGPPVHPPKPNLGLNSAFTSTTTDWASSTDGDQYRRAIYTEVRRSMPYPAMSTFDCPNREICEVRRISTNTPLQALVSLNDPVYVEAAQALARRMIRETEGWLPETIVQTGFRLCLQRSATEQEEEKLVSLYNDAVEEFKIDLAGATKIATDPLGPIPVGMQPAELAAWTTVANVLLNLDEMFMKR